MIEQNDLKTDEYRNTDSEGAILGSIIVNDKLIDEAMDKLDTDDFYDNMNKKIFDCMKAIRGRGDNIDVHSLAQELKKKGVSEDTAKIIVTQTEFNTTLVAHFSTHCNLVKDLSIRRKLIRAAQDIVNDCGGDYDNIDQLINKAEQRVFSVGNDQKNDGLVDAKKIINDYFDILRNKIENPDSVNGISTGYPALDVFLKNLKKGCLYIIAGRPGMGKTAFGLNIASKVAIGQGKTVAIFSLEMSKVELWGRITSMNSLIKQDNLDAGTVDVQQWAKISDANAKAYDSNMFIDDSGGITLSDVRSRCRRLKATNGLDLIVIDYLQLMRSKGRRENRQVEIADISNGLKALAKELSCPIICLSQLNREADGRAERRPLLSDLRDSGAIEQDADGVLMVYRDSYYYPEEANDIDEVEILVRKMRNGKQGTVNLKWYPEYCLFSEEEIDFDTNTPTSDDSISKSDSNTNKTMENDETGFYEWNGIDEF